MNKENIQSSTETAELLEIIRDLRAQIQSQNCLIECMQKQIESLQRLLYGKKTERQHKKNAEARSDKNPRKPSSSSNRNGRAKIPSHIERKPIIHELPKEEQICDLCGGDLHCIGKEVSEQLEYEPARLIVKEHQRCKYGCRRCRQGIKIAPMPAQPIDKGLPGPGLLSEIIISKYQDALPLYRQEQRWERLGYVIPRSTQCDWIAECAFILKPIVDRMRDDCLKSIKIHTDDTPFYIQQPDKVHTGRLWAYVGGDCQAPPCTLYEYSRTRSQKVPQKFFKGYRGYLQADAYPGYDALYADGSIIEVGCWAHARRKYIEVLEADQSTAQAQKAIDFIGQLYDIEQRAKTYNPKQKWGFTKLCG